LGLRDVRVFACKQCQLRLRTLSVHQNFTARCHARFWKAFLARVSETPNLPGAIRRKTMRAAFAVLFCVVSSAALASPHCTDEPVSKWLAPEVMKEKILAMGDHIDVFKTTKGNCYEVYGKDSVGKNIEIYLNPVTGAVFEDVK
jgi:hypothetical protein